MVKNCLVSEYTVILLINNVAFVNVYFPCKRSVNENITILSDIFACVISTLESNPYSTLVLGGDLNCNLKGNSEVSRLILSFIADLNLSCCAKLNTEINGYDIEFTYNHETLMHKSYLDYFFIDNKLVSNFVKILDIDDIPNFSDHVPILLQLSNIDVLDCNQNVLPKLNSDCGFNNKNALTGKNEFVEKLRWDRADLNLYYAVSGVKLSKIFDNVQALYESLQLDSQSQGLYTAYEADSSVRKTVGQTVVDNTVAAKIELFYSDIINALLQSCKEVVPILKVNALKYWWDQEMDILKNNSILSHREWLNAGKPRSGPIFEKRNRDKYTYRNKIKSHKSSEKCEISNDLHECLINKNSNSFWKIWKNKFCSKTSPQIADGGTDNKCISDMFAEHFSKICTPNSIDMHRKMKTDYNALLSTYSGDSIQNINRFNVELVDNIIQKLTIGKASGIDGISVESIKYCHPILVVILTKLFNIMLLCGYVPNDFGRGVMIPIPKSEHKGKMVNINEFRGITLSPVLSKIFEHCLLIRFKKYLFSSSRQFGFKKSIGCNHAIYLVRQTVDYFVSNDSTVNLCALDISKAFDRVNVYGLLVKLMSRNIPIQFIKILHCWYTKIFICVRWNGILSNLVKLNAGVRQGGVLSPALFAIYINDIIVKLEKSGLGCLVRKLCMNVFMYADDILLLSLSISDMNKMVQLCHNQFKLLDLCINFSKSKSVRIGPRHGVKCANIIMGNDHIPWTNEIKYLGVHIKNGKLFNCNLDEGRTSFYRSFNCIFSKIGSESPAVILSLLSAYCLPVITYGLDAINVSARDMQRLNLAYTRSFMKIFSSYDNLVIKQCQYYSGCLPLNYIVNLRKFNFLSNVCDCLDNEMLAIFKSSIDIELSKIGKLYNLDSSRSCLKQCMWTHFEREVFE